MDEKKHLTKKIVGVYILAINFALDAGMHYLDEQILGQPMLLGCTQTDRRSGGRNMMMPIWT
jgi:hypothetical protein